MNLALLAFKGHESMVKEAKLSDPAGRATGYDFALSARSPLDLGVGAQRSGESARALAMALDTKDSGLKGALSGAAFTAVTGFPAYKLITKKGRNKAKASLKHDQVLLTKAIKNLTTPKAIAGFQQFKQDSMSPNKSIVPNFFTSKKNPSPVNTLRQNRSVRKIGLGGAAGAGIQIGLNALGNLIEYETGRGLAPKGLPIKEVKKK